jgi:hypothetical protein
MIKVIVVVVLVLLVVRLVVGASRDRRGGRR